MVQMANLGKSRPHLEPPAKGAAPPAVKLEIEDELEEEHGPLSKKPRAASLQQWGADSGMAPPQSLQCSLLEEPSPLGLRLRKSPSLLDLIQMRLSQGKSATGSCVTSNEDSESGKKKEVKSTSVPGMTDKLKASNFPASLLKIGSWECVSRYEGDLVAKCYYAKHKLVWEVLDGGLKSKIEIQWSDIAALKASCPENGPDTLDIVLARQPLFFRETNPQPRKHTLWQATSDFTNGQASIHRRHFLQCPPGLLSKHFEKLVQCDPRLNSLSQQPESTLESPYFDARCSVFEDQNESKCHGGLGTAMLGLQDAVTLSASASVSTRNESRVPLSGTSDGLPRETLSPSSVMDARVIEEHTTSTGTKDLNDPKRRWDEIKVPGLRSSMSMTDLVNHIGHCITGQTTPGNPLLQTNDSLNKSTLEELTQYLLGDSQVTSASDEQSLMTRVNSLCCLIQQHKDPATAQTFQIDHDSSDDDSDKEEQRPETKPLLHISDDRDDVSKPPPSMSRKESYGELLMHLPRIASLPQFLFNIDEDSEHKAR